jgi:hypothetical protein
VQVLYLTYVLTLYLSLWYIKKIFRFL